MTDTVSTTALCSSGFYSFTLQQQGLNVREPVHSFTVCCGVNIVCEYTAGAPHTHIAFLPCQHTLPTRSLLLPLTVFQGKTTSTQHSTVVNLSLHR